MDTSHTNSRVFSRIAHKNLIASGVVALLVMGGGIYFNQQSGAQENNVAPKVASKTSAQNESDITTRDSDLDGLPDWEERLNGCDPENGDTDGDGTSDGDEVTLGRDPTKRGPNDLLPTEALSFATSSSDLEGIKKEFFASYLASASRDVRETTYRSLIKGFDAKKFKPTNELLDLNVSSDGSVEGLRAYGNAFGLIINKYTEHPLRTEEDILAEGMKTRDDASLRDLQLLVIAYRNFAKDLRALPVPMPLATHHLNIVNGYDGMSRGLLGMTHLFSNPIDGAAGYQTYTRMRLTMIDGYAGVVSYLGAQHITFAPDEPGYPFYAPQPSPKK